jgi:hypothetical protein
MTAARLQSASVAGRQPDRRRRFTRGLIQLPGPRQQGGQIVVVSVFIRRQPNGRLQVWLRLGVPPLRNQRGSQICSHVIAIDHGDGMLE